MINVSIQPQEVQKLSPKITVVGVGGAGGNAVNNMISSGLEGCEFLVCNTDAQALEGSLCDSKLQLGANVTGGLGAGAKPEIGEKAAQESLEEVMEYLDGSNMAFITAGMGGGTGTGAAPVIAKACRDAGILTVGVVTKPFHFEGTHRMNMAESGIEEMQGYVDTLIVIPNQNLFRIANEKTTFAEAFKMADGVLQSGVRGVTDLMVMPGLINLDFADIRSAMLEMGKAMMGTGESEGERRATEAAEAAINNPLLDDVSMKGARGVIINVTGGADMTLFEVDEACNRIRDEVDPNANIIFGSTFDEKLDGAMRVSVVATGIDAGEQTNSISGGQGVRVTTVGKSEAAAPATTTAPAIPAAPETTATLNRSVPQTEVARAMTMNARQSIPSYVNKVTPTATATPAKVEKADDMFEQSEFQAVTDTKTATPSQTSMRGTVQRGKFIPPSPIVPEPQDTVAYSSPAYTPKQQPASFKQPEPVATPATAPVVKEEPTYQPVASTPPATPVQLEQEAGLNAQRYDADNNQAYQEVAATNGLVLRPPTPGASTAEKRKSPSLFERITNVYKGDTQSDEGQGSTETAGSAGASGGFHGGLRAERATANPSQGKLNIDSPAAAPKAKVEDDLDIPAFLRRQAN